MARKIKTTYPAGSLKAKLQEAGFVERDNVFTRGDQRVVFERNVTLFFTADREVIKTTELSYGGGALINFLDYGRVK